MKTLRNSTNNLRRMFALLAILMWASPAFPAGVHALFNLESRAGGPFPTDWFTVNDESQKTGLRVNLPLPNCSNRPSDCEDIQAVNTLDGFNLQPRLSIPFDGPIKVNSVTSQTIFLIRMDEGNSRVIGINEIVWDTSTTTLHVESDELLEQHTRYALIVTRGVRDSSDDPVEASTEFQRFRHIVRDDYKHALLEAIHAARRLDIREEDIAVASVFTTQSVTAVLEKISDQIKAAPVQQANFLAEPSGMRTVFSLADVTGMTFNRHTRVNPAGFDPVALNLALLRIIPGAIEKIAFGKFSAPDYLVHPGEFIPPIGTRTGNPVVQGTNEIYFDLYLPSSPKPNSGWPVVIYGLPAGNRHIPPVAAVMAAHGIATVAIELVGSGFGPLGTLTVNESGGRSVTFPAGGRAQDHNGDGVIAPSEGLFASGAADWIVNMRDGLRQTVVELMQLVRVIEAGMDVDGDGTHDVDASRIYYSGLSLGAMYGTIFLAVEPSVRAGVPNVPGSWSPQYARFNVALRSTIGGQLAARVPALLNAPGIISVEGIPFPAPNYNENLPIRDGNEIGVLLQNGVTETIQMPVINTVTGAMDIQDAFDIAEWAQQSGNPVTYAAHLRRVPLPGVPPKSVIFQFAKGDRQATNPSLTAILRAGDLADRTSYYRADLAVAENGAIPRNPHGFITLLASPNLLAAAIARGAQEQMAVFFASDGKDVIHPEPARLFEVPIAGPLPEELNFIPNP